MILDIPYFRAQFDLETIIEVRFLSLEKSIQKKERRDRQEIDDSDSKYISNTFFNLKAI